MFSVKQSVNDASMIEDFLSLPSRLYDTATIHQNVTEEREILQQTHPLSHYFAIHMIMVYEGSLPVGRALVIHYPDDIECFIGYYDCIDNSAVASLLFKNAQLIAKQNPSIQSIVGPYNASFWLGYRMKIDQFTEKPYMGEPYNKSYYQAQFIDNGFALSQTYVSNEYGLAFNKKDVTEFAAAKHRAATKKYVIKSPKASEFTQTLENAYEMFTTLYSDFPGYRAITKGEFMASFKDLQYVLNYSFVKFAYHNDTLVGFAVAFPDYGNLLHRPMTKWTLLQIILRKIRAQRYIIMYLGVLPEHSGLGKALVRPLVVAALMRGARIIGALALKDKVTASYAKSMIKKQYSYALYEKKI
jgi:hypothetical protein